MTWRWNCASPSHGRRWPVCADPAHSHARRAPAAGRATTRRWRSMPNRSLVRYFCLFRWVMYTWSVYNGMDQFFVINNGNHSISHIIVASLESLVFIMTYIWKTLYIKLAVVWMEGFENSACRWQLRIETNELELICCSSNKSCLSHWHVVSSSRPQALFSLLKWA